MEQICGIYKIENLNGDRNFYIGSSIDILRRFKTHKYELTNNKHSNSYLQNAWNKYGKDSFEFIIIKKCKEKKLVYEEQKQFDAWWCTKLLYNIVNKAGNVCIKKNRINRRMRAVNCYDLRGKFVKRFSSIIEGIRYFGINTGGLSEVIGNGGRTRANIYWVYEGEQLKIKKTVRGVGIRKVCCYDQDGKMIKIFKTTGEAAKCYNVSSGAIYAACVGRARIIANHYWTYEGDKLLIMERSKKHYKPVRMYDYGSDEFLGLFESVSAAARHINTPQSNVRSVCEGRSRYAKKYKFEYA